jgi:ankyrin repeat protein
MPTQFLDEQEELLETVKTGRKERVRALLTCGACRVDAVDREGRTPLHWACQYGHLSMLCLLLSYYQPPKAASCISTTCLRENDEDDSRSRVCQHCQSSSSQRQNNAGSDTLISANTNVINLHRHDVINSNADPPVDVSGLSICDVTLVPDRLSIEDEDNDNANVESGRTAGCTCGRREGGVVAEQGVVVGGRGPKGLEQHVVNVRDAKGHTALHVACNYRHADVASFLATLPCCDINLADRVGNTPLHRAIHAGLPTLAFLLCDMGADVRAPNGQLWTPLHEAIRCGSEEVVRTLLARGCDVNAVTSSVAATTPFLTAVFYYKISLRSSDYGKGLDTLLRLLIEAGCKLSEGDYQWTPLSAAIDIDRSFIASLLLFNGCRFQRAFPAASLHQQQRTGSGGGRAGFGRSNSLGSAGGGGGGFGAPRTYCRSLLVEAFTRCEPCVVQLLVLCGYQPSLEEVEQCARRIPSFSPLFYRISRSEHAAMRGKTDLLHWLRQRACTPRTLMELSRTAVRLALNHAAADTSILKRLPLLPLPTTLRNYVSLSDFTMDFYP